MAPAQTSKLVKFVALTTCLNQICESNSVPLDIHAKERQKLMRNARIQKPMQRLILVFVTVANTRYRALMAARKTVIP
jgi:hypothetical protein